MSRKNNLNPDYYKTAGRGRQGDGIEQASHRQKFNEEEARRVFERDSSERVGDPAEHEGHEPAEEEPQEHAMEARDSMISSSDDGDPVSGQSHRRTQGRKKARDGKKDKKK